MEQLPVDENLAYFDFVKMNHAEVTSCAFKALNEFRTKEKRLPNIWDCKDAEYLYKLSLPFKKQYVVLNDFKNYESMIKKFSFTA